MNDHSPILESSANELLVTLNAGARPRKRQRWRTVLVVLLVVAGGLSVAGYHYAKSKRPVFEMAKVKRGELTVTVTATGTLKPVTMVDVGSEISGRVEKVAVDFNQAVKRGDTLAEIDTRQFRAQVERSAASLEVAQAALLQAEATLLEARQTTARNEALSKESLLSDQELDSSRAVLARAQSGVASARAQVTVAKAVLNSDTTNLEKAVIRSPIDGVIISRQVEPGQTVASSFQTPLLFKLAENLARMELHADVDEADMGLVKEGQAAEFSVDAHPNHPFPAIIKSLRNDPRTVQGVVSYEAVLTVDNSAGLLRPGMTATASITTATRKNALLVPNAALRFTPPDAKPPKTPDDTANDGRKSFVWIKGQSKPVAVSIIKGLTDGRFTEVLGGDVTEGQEVIVDIVVEKQG